MRCWILPDRPPCLILLGRYGDLIQLLPAFKAVYDRTGMKPVVLVSTSYANVFEGVSYVERRPLQVGWWEGVPVARKIAEEAYGGGVCVQWWNDDPNRIKLLEMATKGGLVLQSHGHEWGVDIARWPDYGTSMWDRAGFTREEMLTLPLEFDRRNVGREAELAKAVIPAIVTKPILLYNFAGISSPFAFAPEVINVVHKFRHDFHLIDLTRVQGYRIFDLLGLYDRAHCLLTSDTATLHLAPGAKLPYVAFTTDGWTGSVPKGNCVLNVKYNSTPQRLHEVAAVLEQWRSNLHV